jgi:hypothetical protein
MRNTDGTFYRTNEISRESSSCPNWLSQFAEQAALQEIIIQPSQIKTASKTAVEVMRERQPSVYEMMSAIVSKQKPKYSSVEEAVKDYQKRTGLTDYLQKNKSTLSLIAQNIITEASANNDDEDEDTKDEDEEVCIDEDNEKVMKKNPLEGTDLESYIIGRWHSHNNKKDNTSTDLESILKYLEDNSEEDSSNVEDGNFDIDKLFNYINQLSPEQPKIIVLEVSSDEEEDSEEDDKEEDTDDVRWDDKKKSLVAEGQSTEDDVPEILKNFPAIKGYIVNIIDTNYGIQVPAVLHSIVETFGRDGINQQIFSDRELMSWINKILIEKRHSTEATPMQLGRGVGIQQEFSGSKNSDDPFSLLSPNKGSY